MTSNLLTYRFEGFGNYSHQYDWDTGLHCTISKVAIPYRQAKADEAKLYQINGSSMNLPPDPERGVYYWMHEHGGSRKAFGYVVATGLKDAHKQLIEFSNKFKVKDYIRQDERQAWHKSDNS